jgi:nucleoside-diphosphate-sugar epimerase
VTMMARSFGRTPRLIAVPRGVLRLGAAATGNKALYQRLFEPCVVDDESTRAALGWQPALSQQCAIDEVVTWWRSQH